MEEVVITVELLHESIMKCRQELMFVVADPEEKSCHGILTVRKVFDIDNERMDLVRNLRKRRALDASTVVNERKGRRFECGFCEYESRAQYITARHVARVHQKSIRPTKCDLCPFKTIYSANLKRHHQRVHNSVNLRLRCESKSKSSGSGSKSSGSKSGSKSSDQSRGQSRRDQSRGQQA